MPGGLGPRFALEAGFLIVLAAVAAYARLSTAEIIAVMAGGWLLTAIFEVIAATRERAYLRTGWQPRVEEKAVAVVEPEPRRRRSWFRRAPKTEPEAEVLETEVEAGPEPEALAHVAPATDEAAPAVEAEADVKTDAEAAARPEPEALAPVAPATDDAEPAVEAEADQPPSTPAATDEDTGEFELPPPEPRRWFRRRRAEPPPLTEADLEPARPSARHVRLIRGSPAGASESETPPPDEDDDEERKGADTAS